MKILLRLNYKHGSQVPINYQYPLSAVIYGIISRADAAFASFLHNTGYRKQRSLKSFKFFTFSELTTPFAIQGDRLILKGTEARLMVCFHIPKAAESFVRGLFMHQQFDIADKKSKTQFTVQSVEALNDGLAQGNNVETMLVKPVSPLVCGIMNPCEQHYQFLAPGHELFASQLLNNWKEKFATLHGPEETEEAFANAAIKVLFFSQPPRSRLLTIKAGTPAETKIRGFMGFQLEITGRRDTLELLLNTGAGVYNSAAGCGCLEVVG